MVLARARWEGVGGGARGAARAEGATSCGSCSRAVPEQASKPASRFSRWRVRRGGSAQGTRTRSPAAVSATMVPAGPRSRRSRGRAGDGATGPGVAAAGTGAAGVVGGGLGGGPVVGEGAVAGWGELPQSSAARGACPGRDLLV